MKITKQEAETIRFFDVNNKSIKSLKGIYYLSNLEKLDVSGNKLKNLKGGGGKAFPAEKTECIR